MAKISLNFLDKIKGKIDPNEQDKTVIIINEAIEATNTTTLLYFMAMIIDTKNVWFVK